MVLANPSRRPVGSRRGRGIGPPRFEVDVYAVLSVLIGCFAADEDHFPESFANVYCVRVEECARGTYESEYDGEMAECIDEWTELTEALADNSDEFDEDDAAECLEKLRSETCGDWAEGEPEECSRVYAITLADLFD